MTLILFPSQPFEAREIDPDFALERAAAKRASFATALVDHTRVLRGDTAQAVESVPIGETEALFRGWMLKPSQYAAMYAALMKRGVRLLNDPSAYRVCHYLPESYPFIEGHTPKSVWLPVRGHLDMDAVGALLDVFGSKAIMVKDYVKSQKHYWREACFIPAADDRSEVERVVRRFIELQGDDLNEGLVFREYVPLKIIGDHPRSHMPLAAELRTFWLGGELLWSHRYWADSASFDAGPPVAELRDIASRIPSRLFTMDVALTEEGTWTVVELGDGQVSGLPAPELAEAFYEHLRELLESQSSPERPGVLRS